MAVADTTRITLEDLMDNPAKYGLPSFQQFVKNPELLRGATDELFGQIDKGSQNIKDVREHKYYWMGHKMDSLERVQKAAWDSMGLGTSELAITPELERGTAGKYIIHVYVKPKSKIITGVT